MDKELKARIMLAEADINEIYKKYKIKPEAVITFAQYNVLPDIIKLALSVINKEGGTIKMQYSDLK